MSSSEPPANTVVPSVPEPSNPVPSDPVPSNPVPSDPPSSPSEPPPTPSQPGNPSPSDPGTNPSQNPDPNPSQNPNPNPSQPSGSQPPPTPPPNQPSISDGQQILTQSSTSIFDSTMVVTENGSTVVKVTQISTVLPPGATLHSGNQNDGGGPNTGAIVGGVVGGVVGLAALILIFWFLTKRARQRRLEKEFDGDFNPDRIVRRSDAFSPSGGGTLPELGLDEEESRITPFPASAAPAMSQRPPPTPSTMTSFNTNPYSINPQQHVNDPHPYQSGYPMPVPINRPPSVGDQSQSAYSQSTGFSHPSMYQPQQHAPYPPVSYPQSQGSSSVSGGQIPSRKAQEAGFGRMTVTNPNEVVVHQDGGRIPEQAPSGQQEELPPTYDSIPQDREPAASGSGSRK